MNGSHLQVKEKNRAAAEQPEYRNTGRKRRPVGRRKWLIPVLIAVAVIVACAAAACFFSLRAGKSDTIFSHVRVGGTDVGGMTQQEAAEALSKADVDAAAGKSVTVNLPMDSKLTITAEQAGLGGGAEQAAAAAYNYGRNGGLVRDAGAYLLCWLGKGADVSWQDGSTVDDEAIAQIVDPAADEVNAKLLDSQADIGEDGITLVKGMGSVTVDADAVCTLIRQAFENRDYDDIDYTPETTSTDTFDLKSLYDSIFKEPVDAVYDTGTGSASESQRGVSFDMDAAQKAWDDAAYGQTVFIPFIYTDPAITTDQLNAVLFADKLSSKSTSLSGSSSNRVTNITLAAKSMNGTVLNPGDTFGYNSCLGERTASRGYKTAGVYVNGKHATGIGGGICQGSSTLYYCAVCANLKITERYAHYFTCNYLPWGMDATVSWGGANFKFVNNRDYPVKIVAYVSGGYLTVELWGTNADGSYATLTNTTWQDSQYYYAQTYRNIYSADGTLLSSTKEAYSAYHRYEAGTSPTPAPTTAPTTEPTTAPTTAPTTEPTTVPTTEPTTEPTTAPTTAPTTEPTTAPTGENPPSGE